jgi:hypothetical protein
MLTATTGITFNVSDVEVATNPLPEKPYLESVSRFLETPVEACSRCTGQLVDFRGNHPLIETLYRAFNDHRTIVLSPDIIWLTICQGFARHVNLNAEPLRKRFGAPVERAKLIVRRDEFIKGSPENDWAGVFAEFAALIQSQIGGAQGLVTANFSTTGPIEKAVSEVVLMDSMQSYCMYEAHTCCGIPAITLEGTAEDWDWIRNRALALAEFDLEWWIDPLMPVLDQFCKTARGEVDRTHWESIYKWNGASGSGSPHITGWIVKLFPYLESRWLHWEIRTFGKPRWSRDEEGPFKRNPFLREPTPEEREKLPPWWHPGPGADDIPNPPSQVPFIWECFGKRIEMQFIAGLLGIRQDATTMSLRPEIGWAVRETPKPVEGQPLQFPMDSPSP